MKPTKYVQVDSLARSGTTLMCALIRSQYRCCAFNGAFPEPQACSYGNSVHSRVRAPFQNSINFDMVRFKKLSNQTRKDLRFGIPTDIYKKIVYENVKPDDMYNDICKYLDKDLIAIRWNQGISYIHHWLARPEHYWIAMIRNPMDRACSSRKTHGWSWKDSLLSSIGFIEKLEQVQDKVHIVYYEDLITNTSIELKKVFDYVGYDPGSLNLNLIGSDGKDYVPQGANNKDKNNDHKIGNPSNEIYNKVVGRHRQEMPSAVKKNFQMLRTYPLLMRYFEH